MRGPALRGDAAARWRRYRRPIVGHAPLVLPPGGGETIRPGFEIKLGRPELVLTESRYEPGQRGPDPHVHHHVDAFWVLEGELLLEIGPELEPRPLPAGGFALVPRDVLHSFHNPGPGEARFLNLHAPGLGFDEYLRSGFKAPFDQHYEPRGTGRPASEVVLREPGEGERLELGASEATVKTGVDALAVIEAVIAAGGFAAIPPGVVHSSFPGDDTVRFLDLIAPGGMERYLREAARLGAPPDRAGYDIEFA